MSKIVYFLVPLGILVGGISLTNSSTVPEPVAFNPLHQISGHVHSLSNGFSETLNFCGEAVPVNDATFTKRLNREIDKHVRAHASTALLIRKSARYKKTFLEILNKHNIPEDFFYLMIAESSLSNAISPVGARGFWQMMPAAARQYGLVVNETVDERFHPVKSTEAACRYLKSSYKKFGSWTLVAASYNMGVPGLKKRIREQGTNDYYQLDLNRETGHYLARIMAHKCVFEAPYQYGVMIQPQKNYKPLAYRKVSVNKSIDDLSTFAKEHGVTYAALKNHNPWLIHDFLPASGKVYHLMIPLDPEARASELSVAGMIPRPSRTVQDTLQGDSLIQLALGGSL
ncbi:MAG: lytic transglycosylase domain-containing protein [Bacteroidota bacterium]